MEKTRLEYTFFEEIYIYSMKESLFLVGNKRSNGNKKREKKQEKKKKN